MVPTSTHNWQGIKLGRPRLRRRQHLPPGLALLLALLFFSLPAQAEEPERPNVLLITLDTLRADHLSSYGYHVRTSPVLDRLAEEGARFARAYTTIPLTGPAHVSLFTARYPQENGAKVNGQPLADDPRLLTLAQVLKRHEYRTAAFVSAWPLKEGLTRLNQGFEVYDQEFTGKYQLFNSFRPAEDVTPRAIEWLRRPRSKPFFLWVHYFDPHKPYHLRSEFVRPAAKEKHKPDKAVSADMADRIQRYDSEIAYMDHHIGKLLEALADLGLRDSTLVVAVGDHGESLGEYDYVGHGRHLFESIVRVPLIIRYPSRVPAGRVVEDDVSLLDVMPTILDLVGIRYPLPLPGETLRPLMENIQQEDNGPTYFVTFPGKKWHAPKWLSWLWYHDWRKRLPLRLGKVEKMRKTVWTPGSSTLEVFDLALDEPEAQPLYSGKEDGPYQGQVTALHDWFKATTIYRKDDYRLKQRDLEVLRSLGYVGD